MTDDEQQAVRPIEASELPLSIVLGCVRAIVRSGRGVLTFPTWSVEIVGSALSASARTFMWRGLTGMQLGILDVWAEAHRGSTVEGGPIPMRSGVIAGAVDVALRVLDNPKLDLPCLSDYRTVLVEYAEAGPQESVRDAVRALLAAMNARTPDLASPGHQTARGVNPAPCWATVPAIQRGFRYEVSLYVSIPLAWATLLKKASAHHYDHRCQAEGHHGVINGLYNTAQDSEWPSIYPVTWADLDITTKVAEQLEYHTNDHKLIRMIRAWLRETKDAIARQRVACMNLPGSNDHEQLSENARTRK